MSGPERRRVVLFAFVCVALVGSALAFAAGGNDLASLPAAPSGGDGGREAVARDAARAAAERGRRRLEREVRTAARSFLGAFLRYEVGELGPRVKRALRASATPRFAHELLAAPPRAPPGGFPSPAAIGTIAVAFVSVLPPRVVVSAAGQRVGTAEQLSFVFERRGSIWLASGPGQ